MPSQNKNETKIDALSIAIEHIEQLIYQHIKQVQNINDLESSGILEFANDDYRAGYEQALKSAGYLVSTVDAESLRHKLN
jgi:nucleoside-triphosphatase THEP1